MEKEEEAEGRDVIGETALTRFGITAPLPYQRLVIHSVLCACGVYGEELQAEEPKRRIVILPTGAGKSLCFMLPYFLIRGTTVVVFPLLSLMADQKRRCLEAGIEAEVLKGGLPEEEKRRIFERVKSWERGLLLCNMEILLAKGILEGLQGAVISNVVFDEAHTLFEWGDAFRPALRQGAAVIQRLHPVAVHAFTATASPDGIRRIRELLFPETLPVDSPAPDAAAGADAAEEAQSVTVIHADPDRPNLVYRVLPTLSVKRVLLALFSPPPLFREGLDERLPEAERPAVLFFRNRRQTERVAAYLRRHLPAIPVYHYHAGLSKEEKAAVEAAFFASPDAVLCSTNAYGMGVDKANIRSVVHVQLPPTVESYLQESGRAGRDRAPATAFVMVSPAAEGATPSPLRSFAFDSSGCRREVLLRAMGRESVVCSGCDVCNHQVLHRLPNEAAVVALLRHLFSLYPKREVKQLIRRATPSFYPLLLPFKGWSSPQLDELFQSVSFLFNKPKSTRLSFPFPFRHRGKPPRRPSVSPQRGKAPASAS